MKKLHKIQAFAMAMLLVLGFTACSKEDNSGGGDGMFPPKKNIMIETKSYETWTYFSFEKGIIGTYKESEFDYKNNADWDLAFHKWDIRTNSGESGKGKGGASQTNYGGDLMVAIWSNIPSKESFTADTQIKTYMTPPKMDDNAPADQRVSVPANTVLAKWLEVQMTSIPPKYTMLDRAFVVRTASGKHAAVKFTSYMNDKAEKGYVSFDYVYPLD